MHRHGIVIVTPALAEANNGNWQTARRWARMLSAAYRVRVAAAWDGGDEALMIALHAKRSAPSIRQWRAQCGGAALVVVLTGTDLYGDTQQDDTVQASLRCADRLVVLNPLGPDTLTADLRPKARLILQSCSARATLAKTDAHLRALMVGHLREVKQPQTYFDAARRLARRGDIRLDHIGAALDPTWQAQAVALMAECPRYRWLGALPHGATRRRIQAAHVLVHPSRLEGGAHVVIEAVRSGTPVLASRVDGNVGLLGADYDGYFPVGDPAALAARLQRLRDEPAMLAHLQRQVAGRAALFEPAREHATLHGLLADLLATTSSERR